VESALEERGLESSDSQANFSWVSLGEREEAEVVRGLAERGVIVRAGAALGQEGFLRITYGSREENDRLLGALDEAL
jgi:histidinol-phosphate aminotransferase